MLPAGSDHEFWRKKLATDLAVLPSGEFAEFTRSGTEIVTRVKLEEQTKTVARGALWTEEHVPSDSLFYALAVVGEPTSERPPGNATWVAEQLRRFNDERIQVGGDETTGRGFALLRVGGNGSGQTR